MRARTLAVTSVLLGVGVSFVYSQMPSSGAAAVAAPGVPVVYSMTKMVQFCGSERCHGLALPDEVTIAPDPDPGAQVVGVWAIPSGKVATRGIDQFHGLGFPDAARSNLAIVRFIHPSAMAGDIFEYTVLIKYVKAPPHSA